MYRLASRIAIFVLIAIASLAASRANADDTPVMPDGKEEENWTVRADDGAKYVAKSEDTRHGHYGTQSMQLDFTVEPSNEWWTVLNLPLPPNPDPDNCNVLRLQVRSSVPIKSGGLRAQANIGAGKAMAAVLTERPGRWYPVDIVLPEGEPASGNLQLQLVHTEANLPHQFTLHVDGPVWTHIDLATRELNTLKDMHIQTALVRGGQAEAVIIAPQGGRYDAAVKALQDAIAARTGVRLSVLADSAAEAAPERILAKKHVIALGNMATNAFTLAMYHRWYTLLDLKYPGNGGYVVRTLHNPLATDHNVIWLGGSDDAGVADAAHAFATKLAGDRSSDLSVNWLMDIRLGQGMRNPPSIPFDKAPWQVFSWRDSYRLRSDGKKFGYDPSTYFGWNPISIAGVLYYMTGRQEYLDAFTAMAMPVKGKEPKPNRTDAAFNDPFDPLVKNYHYRAHLVVCVYDLIEENPQFTDAERLFLTNKFIQMQNHYDATDSMSTPNASRHGMWHMICIYTGSRYLNKYYPSARWARRIDNVRKAFASVLNNPTWGERDTLSWVSTSTEPVFEFYMLDGFDEFVKSGTARTYISAMETLWTNQRLDESNKCLTINLLHKAAHMLHDGQYIWLREKMGFDLDVFRIGQSYWPAPDLETKPPTEIVDKIETFPLPETRWKQSGQSVPLEEGFQFLAYRQGLEPADALLHVDGFFGRARTDYHVNALYNLRFPGGRSVAATAYANQLIVRANGMVDPNVPRAAALKGAFATDHVAALHSRVPNMAFSEWDRYLLFLPNSSTLLAIDRARARRDGEFDVTVTWDLARTLNQSKDDPRHWVCKGGPVVHCAQAAGFERKTRAIVETQRRSLKDGDAIEFANLIGWLDDKGATEQTIEPLEGGGYCAIVDGAPAFFAAGPTDANAAFETDAELVLVSADAVHLLKATFLKAGGQEIFKLVRSKAPQSLTWNLQTGKFIFDGETSQAPPVDAVATDAAKAPKALLATLQSLPERIRKPDLKPAPDEKTRKANWTPAWTKKLSAEPIQQLSASPLSGPNTVWAAAHANGAIRKIEKASLFRLPAEGSDAQEIALTAPVLSLLPAGSDAQRKAFAIVAGDGADMIRAYDTSGKALWEQEAQVDPSFRIGDRWQAPWFSNPGDPYYCRGVFALMAGDLWGKGDETLVAARPVTLEFRKLTGELIKRVPTTWGDNSSLAVLRHRGDKKQGNLVLTAKKRSGYPAVSAVDANFAVVANNMFTGVTAGATLMQSWMQWGGEHLAVADLDKDGIDDVILTRTGHWNELVAYDGDSANCKWMASFGPGSRRGPRFITGMVVGDLDGDDFLDVAVSMLNGWVCMFNARGDAVWQTPMPRAANCIAVAGSPAMLVVGCSDKRVRLIDGKTGVVVKIARLDGPINAIYGAPDILLVGTTKGEVARLPLE